MIQSTRALSEAEVNSRDLSEAEMNANNAGCLGGGEDSQHSNGFSNGHAPETLPDDDEDMGEAAHRVGHWRLEGVWRLQLVYFMVSGCL